MKKIRKKSKHERDAIKQKKQELLNNVAAWNSLKDYGDVKFISRKYKLSRTIVSKALSNGDASFNVLSCVHEFYKRRYAAMKKIQEKINDETEHEKHAEN